VHVDVFAPRFVRFCCGKMNNRVASTDRAHE
jgi:hypothetical protein